MTKHIKCDLIKRNRQAMLKMGLSCIYKEEVFMEKTVIKALYRQTKDFDGKEISISGWIRTMRVSKNFGFIELNDGSF